MALSMALINLSRIYTIIKKHVIHYSNLKYLVGPGVQVTKKHKVISFSQRLWLKPYSDFNTQNRAQANHEVEKTIC